MNCLRCNGFVVDEYLFNPLEGSQSGFSAWRCVNCGTIYDDVIRLNQRVPPPLKWVRPPVVGLVLASRRVTSLAHLQQPNGRRGNAHVEETHSGRR